MRRHPSFIHMSPHPDGPQRFTELRDIDCFGVDWADATKQYALQFVPNPEFNSNERFWKMVEVQDPAECCPSFQRVVLPEGVAHGRINVGDVTTDRVVIVNYTIDRDMAGVMAHEEGKIKILHNGVTTTVDRGFQDVGLSADVTLGAALNGSDIELDVTLTGGNDANMLYWIETVPVF